MGNGDVKYNPSTSLISFNETSKKIQVYRLPCYDPSLASLNCWDCGCWGEDLATKCLYVRFAGVRWCSDNSLVSQLNKTFLMTGQTGACGYYTKIIDIGGFPFTSASLTLEHNKICCTADWWDGSSYKAITLFFYDNSEICPPNTYSNELTTSNNCGPNYSNDCYNTFRYHAAGAYGGSITLIDGKSGRCK